MEGDHSASRHRFRTLRIVLLTCLVLFSCCWVCLYFDSLHPRRRAESLIAELKTFPYTTVTFVDVRELAIRHGGTAVQTFPPPPFSQPGFPSAESDGHASIPVVRAAGTCTTQHCRFEIWMRTGPARLPLTGRAAELLYTMAHYIGIRSWVVYSRFEVSNDRLDESSTTVGELRLGKCDSHAGLISWGYEAISHPAGGYPYNNYSVGFPHVTGPPSNVLRTRFVQAAGAPTQRALDIRFECLTTVLHDCRGLGELAPSAWADYSAKLNSPDDAECH